MSKLAKATVGLMMATIIAKILGFIRELILASSYGASMYSDAYITAMNIPSVLFAVIGTAIVTTFIPLYFEINQELGEKSALKFTNNIFNIVMILCIVMTIIGFIFAGTLVKVFAVGFKKETMQIALEFTQILIIGMIFTGMSFMLTGYLQVRNNFIIPGLVSIPKNIIMIIAIILSIEYGPYVMVFGALLGIISEFLFQYPFAIKNGYKYEWHIDFKDKYIKKMIHLMTPVLIGVGVNQINTVVDRSLASTLVEGSISALNYASKLNGFIMALFITSISTVIYPLLSKLSLEDNKSKFEKAIISSINAVILLVTPVSVGAIVLSKSIVKILFQRGEFDEKAAGMTAIALIMYSLGMCSFGLRDILGKIFYALKDTKTPMVNGTIAIVINIVFNIIFIKFFKHAGLALATSISSTLGILLMFRNLKKKLGYFGQDKILKTTIKSIFAACIMGVITYFINSLLIKYIGRSFIGEIISTTASIIVGAVIYIILVIALKIEEVNLILSKFKIKKKAFY